MKFCKEMSSLWAVLNECIVFAAVKIRAPSIPEMMLMMWLSICCSNAAVFPIIIKKADHYFYPRHLIIYASFLKLQKSHNYWVEAALFSKTEERFLRKKITTSTRFSWENLEHCKSKLLLF